MVSLSEKELCWLAGYLEGEGSFLAGSPSNPTEPGISVCSTDEDVIARVALMFGVKYWKVKGKRKSHWKEVWLTKKKGSHAVELMNILKPMMSVRWRQQIDRAIASYDDTKIKWLSEFDVAEIRRLCTTNMKQVDIGKMFGVKRETVNKIKNHKGSYKG